MSIAHQTEPELLGSLPRDVSPTMATKSLVFLRVLMLPFLFAALFTTSLAIGYIYFELFGQVTTGRIVDREPEPSTVPEIVQPEKSYFIHYAFQVGRVPYDKRYTITKAEYQEIHTGQTVQIKYVPFLPGLVSIALLPERNPWGNGLFFLGFALFWNLFVFLMLRTAWILPRIRYFLYTKGAIAVGRITDKKVTKNEGSVYSIYYEFMPDLPMFAGSFTGHTDVPEEVYALLLIGEELTILFEPLRPRRNVSYSHGGYDVKK